MSGCVSTTTFSIFIYRGVGQLPQCSLSCIRIRPRKPESRTEMRGTSGPPVDEEAMYQPVNIEYLTIPK